MDELHEWAKGYVQMKERSKFRNEVRQAKLKCDKWEGSTKIDLHKSDKHQPLPKGPRYKRCTPLVTNHTTILEEAFSLEVPIKLPPTKPHKPGLDTTKYCMYHRCIGHNTEDC